MSTEEQDAVAGRLMREYADNGKQLAARLADAEAHGRQYYEAASYLYGKTGSVLRLGVRPDGLSSLPEGKIVQANCWEIMTLIDRRRELHSSLSKMGFEPKDPPTF